MSYKNTVKDYSQMIGYITRDKTSTVPSAMNQEPVTMDQGERIGLVEGGLLTTGPNKGKYSFRNQVDGEYITRYYDTKKQFNDAIKESQAKPRGGARGDYTKKISTPTTT